MRNVNGRARGRSIFSVVAACAMTVAGLAPATAFAEAGNGPSLVHNWKLDNTGTDSAGTRGATLAGGAAYGAGRVGGAAWFDGVDDGASTAGRDLRTDKSFTVTAWVNPSEVGTDSGICWRVAVGGTGGPRGKFQLGQLADRVGDPGKWVFEMPGQDGSSVSATVATRSSQRGQWLFLVGVHDAPSGQISLSVYDDDKTDTGSGSHVNPWEASGIVVIGQGADSSSAGYWHGGVDDVRLYATNLSQAEVSALYKSYS